MKTLIIGYGNDSRRDDGVGHFVVQQLAERDLPAGVDLETAHQLEVEMSETVAGYDRVIFVDAAIPEASVPVQRSVVNAEFKSHAVAHYLTPSDVLSLCRTLYSREPEATLFSIRGQDFNFGMELSPAVEKAGREVVRQIVEMCDQPEAVNA